MSRGGVLALSLALVAGVPFGLGNRDPVVRSTATARPSASPTPLDRGATPAAREVLTLEAYSTLLTDALDGHSGAAARDRLSRPLWVRLRSGEVAYVPPLKAFDAAVQPTAASAGTTPASEGSSSGQADQQDGDARRPTAAPVQPLDPEALQAAQLGVIRDQLALSRDDDTARRLATLREVLARREFQEPPNPWERLYRWFVDLLPEPSANPAVSLAARVVGIAVVLASAIVLATIAARWLAGLWQSMVREAELRRAGENGVPPSARAARQQAVALAASGDYREAVRQLYLAALLRLEEAGLFAFDRSLTNHEVLGRLAGQPALVAQLAPIVATYDEVWYGVHEPDATTFAAYAERIDGLESSLRAQPGPTVTATRGERER